MLLRAPASLGRGCAAPGTCPDVVRSRPREGCNVAARAGANGSVAGVHSVPGHCLPHSKGAEQLRFLLFATWRPAPRQMPLFAGVRTLWNLRKLLRGTACTPTQTLSDPTHNSVCAVCARSTSSNDRCCPLIDDATSEDLLAAWGPGPLHARHSETQQHQGTVGQACEGSLCMRRRGVRERQRGAPQRREQRRRRCRHRDAAARPGRRADGAGGQREGAARGRRGPGAARQRSAWSFSSKASPAFIVQHTYTSVPALCALSDKVLPDSRPSAVGGA